MSVLAAMTLGAALLTAPAPPARPPEVAPGPAEPAVEAPATADEMQRLLDEVRRIHGGGRTVPVVPAPAPGRAPAISPLPPPRQPAGPPTEGRRLVEPPAERVAAPAPPAPVARQVAEPAPPVPAAPRVAEPALPVPGPAVEGSPPAGASASAAPGTAPGVSPFPRRRPIWGTGRSASAGAPLPQPGPASAGAPLPQPGPAAEADPGRRAADAAGRDASPERQAPQMVARPPVPGAVQQRQVAAPAKLPVCRDPRIDGTMIQQIAHPSWPCGIAQPVRVNAIAGIRLSTPATLDCHTASQLATWVTGVLAPAARAHLGSSVEKIWVMGSYACRRRNNRPSGKLSEHARGRAIDIGGFWLADGRKVTLQDGWGNGADGLFLAQSRSRACGLFHTVLGPGSDRYHHDHLHFDTSPRGGDPYCR